MKKSTDPNYYWDNADFLGWGPKTKMADYKIRELLKLVNGPKVLDVGCGPGQLVDVLSSYGFEAVGIDSETRFVEYAKKNYQGKFLIARAEKLPFGDKEFDCVFIRSVLEHVENDVLVLAEALRVGKKIIIIVPQEVPEKLKRRGLVFSHYLDKTHLRTYTKKSILKLVQASGGEIVEIQETEILPVRSVMYELSRGLSFFKRIGIKLYFSLFPEEKIFLELLVIIRPC